MQNEEKKEKSPPKPYTNRQGTQKAFGELDR